MMDGRLDHEKLDVYRISLEFVAWVGELLERIKDDGRAQVREIHGQLNRASLSALLNIAEGNGKRRRRIRAKFFDDARGSCTECAACLDALVAAKCCIAEHVTPGKNTLVRIVSMLTRLIDRFDRKDADDPKG